MTKNIVSQTNLALGPFIRAENRLFLSLMYFLSLCGFIFLTSPAKKHTCFRSICFPRVICNKLSLICRVSTTSHSCAKGWFLKGKGRKKSQKSIIDAQYFFLFCSCRFSKSKLFVSIGIPVCPVWVYTCDGHWEISLPLIAWLTLTGILTYNFWVDRGFQLWKFHLKISPWAKFWRWRKFQTWFRSPLIQFFNILLSLFWETWVTS